MSMVSIIFKVYPEENSFDSVASALKGMEARDVKAEDVGFGIKVIKAMFVFDDAKTNSSSIEEAVKGIAGVSEVEVEEESLL
jgi:translation elongation factor EF-1beta